MNYRNVKGKWVINKNGVYIACDDNELNQLQEIIDDIKSGENKFYVEDARSTNNGEQK